MSNDADMTDAAPGAEANGGSNGEEFIHEKQRLKILPGSSNTAASFAFEKEDHTLGNALRYIITKNPDVEFCGYSIPHPSEAVMNLRIQTWDDVSVWDVLRKALDDLCDLCDVVEEKFTTARDEFNEEHPDRKKKRMTKNKLADPATSRKVLQHRRYHESEQSRQPPAQKVLEILVKETRGRWRGRAIQAAFARGPRQGWARESDIGNV